MEKEKKDREEMDDLEPEMEDNWLTEEEEGEEQILEEPEQIEDFDIENSGKENLEKLYFDDDIGEYDDEDF